MTKPAHPKCFLSDHNYRKLRSGDWYAYMLDNWGTVRGVIRARSLDGLRRNVKRARGFNMRADDWAHLKDQRTVAL